MLVLGVELSKDGESGGEDRHGVEVVKNDGRKIEKRAGTLRNYHS